MHRIIGLDIGGTKCAVLTADSGAEIELLKKTRFDTHTERGFEYARRQLFDAVRASIAASDRPVEAIGVSCGGPLNSRTGVIQSPPNLPGWDDVPLVRMLEEEFGVEIPSEDLESIVTVGDVITYLKNRGVTA